MHRTFPMDWHDVILGDLIEIKHGFAFKSEFFSDEGNYILLTPGNCRASGGLKFKGTREKFYMGDFPKEYLLSAGDLLVIMTDLVNNAPILGGALIIPEDERFLHNQRLGLIRVTEPDRIDKKFLYYLLNTESYRSQVRGSASGATVRHTSPSRIKQCKMKIPDTVVAQRHISSILSAYDDLFENNRRRIALLERAARLLYREWFVQLRFPGYEHTRIIDGIPDGWERKALGDIVKTNTVNCQAETLPDEINYIDISSVTRGRITDKTTLPFNEAPGRARRKAKSGDVIWSNVRPNLCAFALILDPKENDVFSTGFTILSPDGVPFSYLYLLVTTDEFVNYLSNHATGASYPAVRPDDFCRARVLCPSKRILDLFHESVGPMYRLISILEQESRRLAQARDLLLPRLMNGEITV